MTGMLQVMYLIILSFRLFFQDIHGILMEKWELLSLYFLIICMTNTAKYIKTFKRMQKISIVLSCFVFYFIFLSFASFLYSQGSKMADADDMVNYWGCNYAKMADQTQF